MNNWKIIGKIAGFSAVTAAIITVILAIISYFILGLTASGAPTEYIAFVILSTIMPYLLVTVILLIVAVMSKGAEAPEENPQPPEDEALPPAQPAEA